MILTSPLKGDSFKRAGAQFEPLRVSAQDAPNMTLKIVAGGFQLPSSEVIEYAGGNTAALTAPGSNARWSAVCLTSAAAVVIVNGTSGTSPAQPTIPANYLLLALVLIQAGTTVITNDMVFDARPLFRIGTTDHAALSNLSATNAHPISAITGLQAALDAKTAIVDNTNDLAGKADTTGTVSTTFILNSDATGVPATNAGVVVERGSSSNVDIRWNETTDIWEYTNDGVTYLPLGATESLDEIADLTTLSGVAANSTDLGTFTGTVVTDNGTVKAAIQELATAVDLNTAKVTYPSGDATKVGFISVTQAVNLDTMESGIATKFNATAGNTVYADLAAVNVAYVTPVDGDFCLVRGQGAAFFDGVTSPNAWVLAADGVSLVV